MVLIMNNINLGVDIVLVDRINKILNSKKKLLVLFNLLYHRNLVLYL